MKGMTMAFLKTFERRDLWAKDPALVGLWGRENISGTRVDHTSAMEISSFYACVRIISETVASLPCILYRRIDEQGKNRAPEHPLFPILRRRANEFHSAMEFFELMQSWVLTWGNGFAWIQRNGGGEIVNLWPMQPDRMKIKLMNGRLWYYWTPPPSWFAELGNDPSLLREITLRDDEVLHVKGLGDWIIGYSPVDRFRETLGLCKAEEEYRARFFRNDARPGAVVEYPGQLSDTAYQRYKQDWQETYAGLGNKFKVAFLEGGLKWHDVGFPPETAEFIEGRKFQIEEVARIFQVPLILLQSTEKATSWGTGIEQFNLAFLTYTIRPWLVRWEERIDMALLSGSDRERYFVEFLFNALERADIKTRHEAYRVAIESGWMSRNEARALENMNPATGLDSFLVQQNLAQVDKQGNIIPINKSDVNSENGFNGAEGG